MNPGQRFSAPRGNPNLGFYNQRFPLRQPNPNDPNQVGPYQRLPPPRPNMRCPMFAQNRMPITGPNSGPSPGGPNHQQRFPVRGPNPNVRLRGPPGSEQNFCVSGPNQHHNEGFPPPRPPHQPLAQQHPMSPMEYPGVTQTSVQPAGEFSNHPPMPQVSRFQSPGCPPPLPPFSEQHSSPRPPSRGQFPQLPPPSRTQFSQPPPPLKARFPEPHPQSRPPFGEPQPNAPPPFSGPQPPQLFSGPQASQPFSGPQPPQPFSGTQPPPPPPPPFSSSQPPPPPPPPISGSPSLQSYSAPVSSTVSTFTELQPPPPPPFYGAQHSQTPFAQPQLPPRPPFPESQFAAPPPAFVPSFPSPVASIDVSASAPASAPAPAPAPAHEAPSTSWQGGAVPPPTWSGYSQPPPPFPPPSQPGISQMTEFIQKCEAGKHKNSDSGTKRRSRSPNSRRSRSPSQRGGSPSHSYSRRRRSRDRTRSPEYRRHGKSSSRLYSSSDRDRDARSRSTMSSSRESRSRDSCGANSRRSRSDSRSRYRSSARDDRKGTSERELLLTKWRNNYCANTNEMKKKLEEISRMTSDEIIEKEKQGWTRSAPADLYYERDTTNPKIMLAKPRLIDLCEKFEDELVRRAEKVRGTRPLYNPPPRKDRMRLAKHKSELSSSSDSSSEEESSTDEEDCTMEELERKRLHPYRLHQEMWYNDSGEMNDGPLCRCSAKARRYGIRHGIYAGEDHLPKCDIRSNNSDKLYHYRITISPPTNFLTKTPTIIKHDEHEFIFEGFSMFSHFPLDKLPTCKVIRFNIEYTILYIEEALPENFTIRELDLFFEYLFHELLELVDLNFKAYDDSDGCSQFHFMPRFVRELADNGKEILSMNEVLQYLLASNIPLVQESQLHDIFDMPQSTWQDIADEVKGMVVTFPGMKPCSLRVDQLDRDMQKDEDAYPEIVHFGIRPPQLSYAGNPEYQKCWRDYVKFRHLLANSPKPSFEDKRKLEAKENKLQEMRTQSKMKRDVTVAVSAKGFYQTGIMCDIIQHAMLIPVLVCHLRFHRSCDVLEKEITYKFKNRYLLQLALTHPSYRENFGTNPDHARNSLTNCGIRQPEYGDRRIHYMNTRKRGINTLINIMSRFGKKRETESNITHNERLEFLGDAVVEFLTSIHLFHIFPNLEEGGLATYRAALVQNQHLALLAKWMNLEAYMLYAHGSDLCHDLELRHAMANCFEALMGALFLDGGIKVPGRVFAEILFMKDPHLLDTWMNYAPHPLQLQEPEGDRKWIPYFEILKKLTEFEDSIGVQFKHIRLLARAFTDRSIGYTNLTLGSNQRLEFLGDTVLQLIASEYLYKFFPEHHEGHLSLLRSSLVNNKTQAVVCDDLGMTSYALYANPKVELKTKDRADLLEAFLGALYVDQGMTHCQVFCNVCFFPRLQDFIMNQDWNDPKSKLQQCCLTLRTMDGGEPDIPVYKVIECKGPTNTRVYTVAVYFRGERLAKAAGHSIQQAEMNAAKEALENSEGLFPQLHHQKRVIAKSLQRQQQMPTENQKSNDDDSPPKNKKSTTGGKRSVKHKESSVNEKHSPAKDSNTAIKDKQLSPSLKRELPTSYKIAPSGKQESIGKKYKNKRRQKKKQIFSSEEDSSNKDRNSPSTP